MLGHNIALDSSENVYVADLGNFRIQKFSSNGAFMTKWGSSGSGIGQFSWAYGIAVDGSDYVYVIESGNNRVQKFDSNGVYQTQWGSGGSLDGQFNVAYAIDADAGNNIYVLDSGNNRVQKFDSNGNFITKWGASGSGDSQFSNPLNMAVDPAGFVYVVDTGNTRVQKFDLNGNFIAKWGSPGSAPGQLDQPGCIAIDPSGNVYVGSNGLSNQMIQKFDSNGNFLAVVGNFSCPYGMHISPAGILYISSTCDYNIQKLGLCNTPTETPVVSATNTCVCTLSFTPTRTFTATRTATLPAGTSTATPTVTITKCCPGDSLDLQVSGLNDSCTADRLSFNFRIYYNSGIMIVNNTLKVRMWTYSPFTPSVTITSALIQPGNMAITTSYSTTAIPDCFDSAGRSANTYIDINLTPAIFFLPGYYMDVTGYISGANPFDAACDDYSRFGVTSMGSSPYVCLYDPIGLVAEEISPGVPDPLTGVEPCSIPTSTATAGMPTQTITNTCGCTPSYTNTPTITITATPSVTETLQAGTPTFTQTITVTPTPGCAPVISVNLKYNPGAQNYVLVEITSSDTLTGPVSARIVPFGGSQEFTYTAGLVSTGPPSVYAAQYPETGGQGDIESVFVSGIDACGDTFTSGGSYTKEVITPKEVAIFKNIINPESGERCRLMFTGYSGEKVSVKVYSKSGTLIRSLYQEEVTTSGQLEVEWDGTNDNGEYVVSGIYIISVDGGSYKAVEKVAVIH
jgi:hypothetical protein